MVMPKSRLLSVRHLDPSSAQKHVRMKIEISYGPNIYSVLPTEPESTRHLVVGGDVDNKNLWMSDSEGKVWRQSVKLPYGDGKTSYGATLIRKEDKVRIWLSLTGP